MRNVKHDSGINTRRFPLWWKLLAVLWSIVLLLGVLFLFERVVGNSSTKTHSRLFDTNLLSIFPQYQNDNLKHMFSVIDKQRNQQLLLSVSFTPNDKSLKDPHMLLDNLSKTLKSSGLFFLPNVKGQVKQNVALSKSLWKYRQQLLSKEDLAILNQGKESVLVESAMLRLYGFSSLDESTLRGDPLFLFQRYLQSTLPAGASQFKSYSSWLIKSYEKKNYYLLPLTLKGSAFDTEYQQSVKKLLEQLKSSAEIYGGKFLAAGAVIFAEEAFSQSQKEISTVGLGGGIGIVLLLILVFRSTLPLLSLLGALTLSLSLALSVCLWYFGSLHIFAFLCSTAIVGISADYGFHFFTDVYTNNNSLAANSRIVSVKRIFSGLTLGMISSVLAYTAFKWSGVNILAQVSLFALVALPSMYLTVVLLLPFMPLPRDLAPLPVFLQKMSAWLVNNSLVSVASIYLRRPLLVIFSIFSLLIILWFVPANDDLRSLKSLSNQSLKVEKHLRGLLDKPYINQYLILLGGLDEVLAAEKRWVSFFDDDFNDLAVVELLPTEQHQKINYEAYNKLYHSSEAKEYASQLGISDSLGMNQFIPLDVKKIARHPVIKKRFSNRLIELSENRWALLMPIKETIKDTSTFNQLKKETEKNIDSYLVNPTSDMSAQFKLYRHNLSLWLIAVVVLLMVLAFLRYRKNGIIVALLPTLTALSALVITSVLGFPISLFSLLAVFLLLGMGLDYVIFLAECENPNKVMVSLCLSCITTILSFGLLAFSETSAVATFGTNVVIGMILILLLSPIVAGVKNEKT